MTEIHYSIRGKDVSPEEGQLRELEITIERGLPTFVEVGQALGQIRSRKLYRLTHSTFEDYCRERWGMTRQHANRLISASLEPIGAKTEGEARRLRAEQEAHEARPTFNRVNDNIGWARWSWNPVTGCLHDCDYCYARDLAERFYPQGFAPTFLPERLGAPQRTKIPTAADGDPAWRRVFTCSMADLFGKWVPQKWIDAVFEQIVAAPQWEFLCLTKFPQRFAKLDWPENVWAGTTVDKQHRVALAQRHFAEVKAGVKWLSCEPLLEPLKFDSLEMFDWVVIGASTGSRHAEPFAPPFDWVVNLYQQARAAGCKVYLKHNLFAGGVAPGMEPVREWPR
jgi:protein gp37